MAPGSIARRPAAQIIIFVFTRFSVAAQDAVWRAYRISNYGVWMVSARMQLFGLRMWCLWALIWAVACPEWQGVAFHGK